MGHGTVLLTGVGRRRGITVALADQGIRANAINPGPVDTGWMDDEIREQVSPRHPPGASARRGTPVIS
ncbi:hypothetical protein GCM10011492_28520 [Flexivirga endophytica]|uniref:SDR family oxidoreductase n=1 Tax=Flexivirga endophytica TaxID=1849103 RepID=A0A916WWV8_9MICO|nr:hypothetical protein GCM10011492_28520 [Flexivirga endophytica]GHB43859.1 hypothetical protein GCM10008112_10900 [Flexivirga endophytica]